MAEFARPCVATGLGAGAAEARRDRAPWARDCTHDARNSCARDRLATVHCVVHCVVLLFMNIVQGHC